MFTLFDLFELLGPLLGAILGGSLGSVFGVQAAIVGAVLGFIIGRYVGALPADAMVRGIRKNFKKKSVDQLRRSLRAPNCLMPNLILLELSSRGENILPDLPVVLDFLESEDQGKRGRGWAALTSAYPELVAIIPDYRINDNAELCRKNIGPLRRMTEQAEGDNSE